MAESFDEWNVWFHANEADDDQTGDNEEPPQIGAADPV